MTVSSATSNTNNLTSSNLATTSSSNSSTTIDWNALINAAVNAKLARATSISTSITANQAKVSAYQALCSHPDVRSLYAAPEVSRLENLLYGSVLTPIDVTRRSDLVAILLTGVPGLNFTGPRKADLLRLNTGIPPTSADHRSRLAFLTLLDADPNNDDAAGFPNGRRVSDDVTDISARAVAGVLAGGAFGGFPYNRIGDGVNTNDAPYRETFPYVGYAHSGRDSRHVDPSEPGCIGTCPTN